MHIKYIIIIIVTGYTTLFFICYGYFSTFFIIGYVLFFLLRVLEYVLFFFVTGIGVQCTIKSN
jgi:hypothetical protein